MNIGIFTNNYLPRVNGVSLSIESFRKELEQRGHRVFIFAPKYHNRHQEKKVFRFPSLRVFNKTRRGYYPIPPVPLTFFIEVKKIIQDLNLDIIHSHQPYVLGKTAQRCAQELSIPLIFTNHTPYSQYLDHLSSDLRDFLGPYFASLVADLVVDYANNCQLVTVPTVAMSKLLTEMGVRTSIKIIPSGLDLTRFQQEKDGSKIRKKYRLKKDDILLVLVSRLSYEKNVGFLLEVFQKIIKKRDNAYLMIVGEGLDRGALESMADSLGLQNKVIFVGQVDYHNLPCYYKAGDIFVYPSLIDSQGLVLIEAMASGLPVVAMKETLGPQDIVSHNKTGFLVPNSQEKFTQAVLKLIDDAYLRQKFSQTAQAQVQQYSIQSSTDKLVAAYRAAAKA